MSEDGTLVEHEGVNAGSDRTDERVDTGGTVEATDGRPLRDAGPEDDDGVTHAQPDVHGGDDFVGTAGTEPGDPGQYAAESGQDSGSMS